MPASAKRSDGAPQGWCSCPVGADFAARVSDRGHRQWPGGQGRPARRGRVPARTGKKDSACIEVKSTELSAASNSSRPRPAGGNRRPVRKLVVPRPAAARGAPALAKVIGTSGRGDGGVAVGAVASARIAGSCDVRRRTQTERGECTRPPSEETCHCGAGRRPIAWMTNTAAVRWASQTCAQPGRGQSPVTDKIPSSRIRSPRSWLHARG